MKLAAALVFLAVTMVAISQAQLVSQEHLQPHAVSSSAGLLQDSFGSLSHHGGVIDHVIPSDSNAEIDEAEAIRNKRQYGYGYGGYGGYGRRRYGGYRRGYGGYGGYGYRRRGFYG